MAQPRTNKLFYGNNLDVLRDPKYGFTDESVDLIYLDPPFNSQATYNVLFRTPTGAQSQAQIAAFGDTWHWGVSAELALLETLNSGNNAAADVLKALRDFLGQNDMMAYLAMMAIRLIELHRVLKPSGSLYLHCDPTASHYLKLVLDAIFGLRNFRNEIIWRRTGSHNSSKRYGPVHDVIFFYSKTDDYYFRRTYRPYLKGHVEGYFKSKDEKGHFWTNALTGPGIRHKDSGLPWRNYDPTAVGRHWAIPGKVVEELGLDAELTIHSKLDALDDAGFIDHPSEGSAAMPTYRQYLDKSPGMPIQDIWAYQPHTKGVLYNSDEGIDEDVRWLVKQGDIERTGYQTQKPAGLLERIVTSSCPPQGVVLDPFCGCGTTVHAAQKLGYHWLGIDITTLAIGVIDFRLQSAFPGIKYEIEGAPKDVDGARYLWSQDEHQFQWWACRLVNAVPHGNGKKGADSGIDGRIFFQTADQKIQTIIVSVKGGKNVDVSMIRDLGHVVEREKAKMGIFITMAPPTKPMTVEAVSAGFYETDKGDKSRYQKIQILTVSELFEGKMPDVPPRYSPFTPPKEVTAKQGELQFMDIDDD